MQFVSIRIQKSDRSNASVTLLKINNVTTAELQTVSKWWNSQRQRIIILLLVCLFLGMGLVAVEAFVTLRPSEEAAAAAVIDRTLVGSSAVNASYRVIQTYPLRRAQIVVGLYTQHTGGRVVQQFYIDYVTRHLLTGTGVYSSVGEYMLTTEGTAPLSFANAQWENATSVGGVVQSPHVKTVEATWADATLSTSELIDGTFLLVREDGVPLAWVVGLDDRGERVPDSLMYANNLPHWLEYERTRWITTPEGI